MVEGARLESVYTVRYRGFESLALRQFPESQHLSQSRTVVSYLKVEIKEDLFLP